MLLSRVEGEREERLFVLTVFGVDTSQRGVMMVN